MDGVTGQRSRAEAATPARGGKFLTFKLGAEEYGLPLIQVREIIALMDITPVPLSPPYVRGVMNLRGRVIPVVDLRRRFAMDPTPDHDRKCIIVVDVERGGAPAQMSILVDAVSEVLHIPDEAIDDPPPFHNGMDQSFLHGIAKAKTGVKILLHIDHVLSAFNHPSDPGAEQSAAAETAA